MYYKYPRTLHLPWSPGTTSDDRIHKDISFFDGRRVIVTEKLDGENTSMYSDHIHARSPDSVGHPSRNWVKTFHSNLKFNIPEGLRICGENVFAEHSIHYTKLPSYFLVFGIYEGNKCLSWDDTVDWCNLLDLHTVPVLYDGVWNEEIVKALYTGVSKCGGLQEGYVVRVADSFTYEADEKEKVFEKDIAKFVRKGHVQTDEHWLEKPVVMNGLVVS